MEGPLSIFRQPTLLGHISSLSSNRAGLVAAPDASTGGLMKVLCRSSSAASWPSATTARHWQARTKSPVRTYHGFSAWCPYRCGFSPASRPRSLPERGSRDVAGRMACCKCSRRASSFITESTVSTGTLRYQCVTNGPPACLPRLSECDSIVTACRNAQRPCSMDDQATGSSRYSVSLRGSARVIRLPSSPCNSSQLTSATT